MLGAVLALAALFALSRLYKLWSGLKAVDYTPGIRCATGARFSLSALFRTRLDSTLFNNPGSGYVWEAQRAGGFKGDIDIISVVPWLQGDVSVIVSSLEMIQYILRHSDTFDKEQAGSKLLGVNVLTVQKEPWKRHRRVVNPAFSKKLHDLVWKQSMQTFRDMVDVEGWDKEQSVTIPVLESLTTKRHAHLISIPPVQDAPVRLITPRWAYVLPIQAIKRVDMAFNTVFSFMRAQIALRREKIASEEVTSDDAQGKNTIFDNIVKANIDGGKFAFDEDEVIANTLIMLLAGHETTPRTVNATLALLALYEEEQEKVYEEIRRTLPDGRDPDYEDFESFNQIRKCVQEAMRLYPPAPMLFREVMHDTHLNATDKVTGGISHSVTLKKGTRVILNLVDIHRDPRHFPEPEAFKPSRWDDDFTTSSDTFGGFGHGLRACIGRKFALTELTCFMVMLLRDWRVEVDLAEGETRKQWQKRVMTDKITVLHHLPPISVRFTRRKLM
ncbi:hypothetical protein BOTBODRAFT_179703 [Botryobasidium botryosum FD-172 SS1]|uniref:Cytochrome P450 n=1 Tax=Botryobasidium botryosum (strain FD-172 SS1) TaxID=930990 RepID=A0A067LYX9_BOTB1|nr:hypothetical protein BOTBODRAFT_179703 [Botryobasidium botryosum FD-172 SS1]